MVAESLVPVNGINLCVETFGEPADPAVLLIAGGSSSMDWWEDEFCRRLAAGSRFVIRYDHRDTGRSTSFPAGAPPYSQTDLAADALGVLDALGVARAHLVGLGLGGALAQRLAVAHPQRLLSLTMMATGPADTPTPTPPDPTATTSPPPEPSAAPPPTAQNAAPPPTRLSAATPPTRLNGHNGQNAAPPPTGPNGHNATSQPTAAPPAGSEPPADWSDRRASVGRMIAEVRDHGGPFTADEPHLRRLAERVYDRTHDMAAGQANHRCCASGPPVRPHLGTITSRTLVLHGTLDTVVPPAHARALAAEIPGARLVWLEGVGHEFPPSAVWSQVIDEITGQAARGRQPA
jgi:pimeloyl-ACP methyl ester carboxylesterase